MRDLERPSGRLLIGLPWFRTSPGLTLATVGTMFVVVLTLRLVDADPRNATSLLYTLPVSLAALAFGRTAGLAAGLLAVALVVTWVVVRDVDLTLLGWVSRVVPLLILGVLVGDASDRLAEARRRQAAAAATEERHREAVEVNDTLIQGMAASKWQLEAGLHEQGLSTLEDTIRLGQQLVSKLLRESDMGVGGDPVRQD